MVERSGREMMKFGIEVTNWCTILRIERERNNQNNGIEASPDATKSGSLLKNYHWQ